MATSAREPTRATPPPSSAVRLVNVEETTCTVPEATRSPPPAAAGDASDAWAAKVHLVEGGRWCVVEGMMRGGRWRMEDGGGRWWLVVEGGGTRWWNKVEGSGMWRVVKCGQRCTARRRVAIACCRSC